MKEDNILLRIEPGLKKKAKELADNEGRTLSNWIRQLIKLEVER